MKPSRSRRLVRGILTDEVKHSRLGWRYLSCVGDVRWLSQHMDGIMNATVSEELRDPRIQESPSEALVNYGVFPQVELRDILREATEGVLIPGFDLFGINTESLKRWVARHFERCDSNRMR